MSRFIRLPASRRRQGFAIKLALGLSACSLGMIAAPSIAATTAEASAPLDLSQYRGKVVYLDFWASWCAPCKLSFRFMNTLRATYRPEDLVIVTVNMDRDRNAAAAFLREVGGTLPVVYEPKGVTATRYKVSAMPTSVLIGRDGRTRFVHRGYFDNKTSEYRQHIGALVSEHP